MTDDACSGAAGSEHLAALMNAALPLAPHVEPAVGAYLASKPDPADARAVVATLGEVRDLIQAQLDRVADYVSKEAADV
jgi:hypothetical protein